MTYRKITMVAVITTAIAVACIPFAASAQSPAYHAPTDSTISFEFAHPFFEGSDLKLYSGAGFLNVRHRLGRVVALVEVPVAHFSGGGESQSALGNILIGAEVPAGRARFEMGLRLPTASDNFGARLAGAYVDIGRLDAFLFDGVTARAVLKSTAKPVGWSFVGHGGVVAAFRSDEGADNEAWITYGGEMVNRSPGAQGGIGVYALTIVTGDGGSYGERTLDMAQGWAIFGSGRVRPGVSFGIPLDNDLKGFFNGVLSLQLHITR